RALQVCSSKLALDEELNYLKAIAIDRGFSPNIINQAVKKFSSQHTKRHTLVLGDYKNSVVIPFFPSISYKVAHILQKFNFRVVYSPINKIPSSILKDPIPDMNSWGIYRIPCQCGLIYIGQTKRALKFRVKEHEAYVRKKETQKSSVAQHCWSENHTFNFSAAKIIQKTSSIGELDFLEAFHIHKNLSVLVNDPNSNPNLPSAFKEIMF
ncbi:MAG: GIY-YIG nuclease family protein, partial [Mycoplasma sp.]|nr:GIY-YIG nuclease family protein [Mycoplasma sp.]